MSNKRNYLLCGEPSKQPLVNRAISVTQDDVTSPVSVEAATIPGDLMEFP